MGTHFQKITLKSLGLRIQLGHPLGQQCISPECAGKDCFVLLDVDGVHEVAVDFCGCKDVQPHKIQLLRMRWWPATTTFPKTGATFRLLEWFHILGNQSKVSAYEYYSSLVRRTDNTRLLPLKVWSFFQNATKMLTYPLFRTVTLRSVA